MVKLFPLVSPRNDLLRGLYGFIHDVFNRRIKTLIQFLVYRVILVNDRPWEKSKPERGCMQPVSRVN